MKITGCGNDVQLIKISNWVWQSHCYHLQTQIHKLLSNYVCHKLLPTSQANLTLPIQFRIVYHKTADKQATRSYLVCKCFLWLRVLKQQFSSQLTFSNMRASAVWTTNWIMMDFQCFVSTIKLTRATMKFMWIAWFMHRVTSTRFYTSLKM